MEKSLDFYSPLQVEKCPQGRRLPKDRISSLPDAVLMNIVSFLTFKEVVMTSLLSRRWVNLWVNTPVLDFHAPISVATHISDGQRQNYVEWVNCTLRRHMGHYLKEFKILCSLNKFHQKDINKWLAFALTREVQSLELNFFYTGRRPYSMHKNYVFPDRFLRLGGVKLKSNSDGGEGRFLQFDFKCLKSLSLKNVDVTNDAIDFFLLNCPFLERLEVAGTLKLVNLVISDPTLVLKYLKINHCYNLDVLIVSNLNLVSLDISTVTDLTLADLPMVVELSIEGTDLLSCCFRKASSCCSQLETLTLETMGSLKDIPYLPNHNHCQLTKLKRLVIQVGAYGDESLTRLISIISYCPLLEEFVLKLLWMEPERTGRTILEVGRHSTFLESKSLKVFEFKGYYGRVSDVELIKHVVEYAVGLEKIIIDSRDLFYLGLSTCRAWLAKEEEARSIASQQFVDLRVSIPPHVTLVRCGF